MAFNMQFSNKLTIPGDHPISFSGKAGLLEGILTVPATIHSSSLAVLGHPHSLQGGTMNNKVVTTMARAFKELGIVCLRFNFRGVGLSAGTYDEGIGESDDMLELVRLWQDESQQSTFIFAGFSFGSYVAYRAAAQTPDSSLITIAPPVHHYDYKALQRQPHPWIIIQGDQDEIVPASFVEEFAQGFSPPLPVIDLDTGHFFHGKLVELKTQLMHIIHKQFS